MKTKNKIILDARFFIVKDTPYNWVLHYEEDRGKINQKTNRPIISREQWYYPNLKLLLKKYVDQYAKVSPATSIEELIQRIDEVESNIDNIISEIQNLSK